jgi:hypothetical protein
MPLMFGLDDSLAVTPHAKLPSQQSVAMVARVSKGGYVARPGDLVGQVEFRNSASHFADDHPSHGGPLSALILMRSICVDIVYTEGHIEDHVKSSCLIIRPLSR